MFVRIAFAILLFSAVVRPSIVRAEISQDLLFCSKMKSGQERLACYDAAARLERTQRAQRSEQPSTETAFKTIPPKARNWRGFVVGIGGAATTVKSSSNGVLTSNPGGAPGIVVGGDTSSPILNSSKGSGAAIELHAGYMVQSSSLVVGVQADVLLPALRGSQNIVVGPCSHPACTNTFYFGNQGPFSVNWVASAALKAGVATPDNLFYALGGVSYADFSATTVNLDGPSNFSFSFPHVGFGANGWLVGFGWERRIADAWSLYAEYRLTRFSDFNQHSAFQFTPCPNGLTCTSNAVTSGSVDLQSFRIGVNHSFAMAD